ncbi:LysR family transcriptional regulator [Nocardioides sp. Soil796]|uniref:LysR family transcriptional regulator n=1 Tax=Nocardioides sp. Soil796 TaxID=1736412 RepID=UPI0009EAE837|nr:LysR family transcriptional regulator [Nocardioides sp. Soil796]
MNPTLAQLRVVVVVAEERNFSRAAKRLLVAQSSLSRTVAEVERSVGAALFERTTRHVEVTPDGVAFVAIAERVLAAYDEGMTHFSGYLEGTVGVLRIAALPSLAATLLPGTVIRLRRQRPQVRVEVEDVLAGDVVEKVRGGEVDLALTAAPVLGVAPPATVDGLPFTALATDTFRCLMAPDHHLAGRTLVAWEELSREAFVSFDGASSVRAIVEAIFASRDVEPVRRVSARNVATVAGLCAAGLGVSAVPAFVLPLMGFAGLASVPLVDPVVSRHIGVLTDPRRERSRAATTLLQVLREQADEDDPLPPGATWN